jgi:uncharacterized membrane protein
MVPPRPTDAPGVRTRALLGYSLLVALLVGMIELDLLEYTYERLGIDHRFFAFLLFLSLLGSLVNVPLGALTPKERVGAGGSITPDGGPAPGSSVPGRTLLAVNVGGALVPTALSLWLLGYHGRFGRYLLAVAAVAILTNRLARPVRGLGIAVPIFAPPLVAAGTALLLDSRSPAALAYAAGSLGTLIGADLLNLGKIRALGAPVVSIGGAGTFDGVFLSGIIAVLLAR